MQYHNRILPPLVVVLILAVLVHAQPCEPEWSDEFGVNGIQPVARVLAAHEWNDGSGAALYLGGVFRRTGEDKAVSIVKWNGTEYVPLGQGVGMLSGGDPSLNPGRVHAIADFDPDGPGPLPSRLYVGGRFTRAVNTNGTGIITTSGLAAWSGTAWVSIPNPNISDTVYALTVFDDGNGPRLYAAGGNDTASGHTGKIAVFNGTSWTTLGGVQLDYAIRSLVPHDEDGDGPLPPRLFAGGQFSGHVRRIVNNVYETVGAPDSLIRGPYALRSFDADGSGPQPPLLYAGGPNLFSWWDGADWTNTVPAGDINALQTFDFGAGTKLYVGGSIGVEPPVGESPLAYRAILAYDGATFSPLGDGVRDLLHDEEFTTYGSVSTITPTSLRGSPVLFVGGEDFQRTGEIISYNMGFWDGGTWQPQYDRPTNGVTFGGDKVFLLDADGDGPLPARMSAISSSNLSPPGQAGGVAVPNPGLVQWTGQAWAAVPLPPLDPAYPYVPEGYVAYDDGGGEALFAYVPDYPDNPGDTSGPSRFALFKFDGSSWIRVPGDIGRVFTQTVATTVFDTDGDGPVRPWLVIAGMAFTPGDIAFPNIIAWDGTLWHQLGGGLPDTDPNTPFDLRVRDLQVFDDGQGGGPALYAAGTLSDPALSPIDIVSRFSGGGWTTLATSGDFSPVPTGNALSVADLGSGPSLYVAGNFADLGGTFASMIARWTGTQWEAVGDGIGAGPGNEVRDAAAFDDGSGNGPALYACGYFSQAGGVPARNIARWSGASGWSAVDAGLTGTTSAIASSLLVFDDDGNGPSRLALYAAGTFDGAGGHYSMHVARWGCPPVTVLPCPGDYNDDGSVDLADLISFNTEWQPNIGQTVPPGTMGDYNGDGSVDLADLIGFNTDWQPNIGVACP